MKTPFHTNIAQLKKELQFLEGKYPTTRTFTKVEIHNAHEEDCLRRAKAHLQDAINWLSNIKQDGKLY
jgi:hypothetical protein